MVPLTGTTLTSEQDTIPDTTSGTLQATSEFDGNQNQTSYQYDNAGNATQTTTPSGTGAQPATTTTQYTQLGDDSCDGSDGASRWATRSPSR